MLHLISFSELLKPLFHLFYILLIGSITLYAAYSLRKRFDLPLALIVVCSLFSLTFTTIWFVFSLQTGWKITLLPKEIRQALYVVVQFGYPIEIILWSIAFYLLVRRNTCLPPPLPPENKE